MMYTTHVLDAAIQTVNALHQKNAFDFGISLGDTCNNTQYNELRWYIDVIDGKVITPAVPALISEQAPSIIRNLTRRQSSTRRSLGIRLSATMITSTLVRSLSMPTRLLVSGIHTSAILSGL